MSLGGGNDRDRERELVQRVLREWRQGRGILGKEIRESSGWNAGGGEGGTPVVWIVVLGGGSLGRRLVMERRRISEETEMVVHQSKRKEKEGGRLGVCGRRLLAVFGGDDGKRNGREKWSYVL
ncbi:hypothetical protein HAX54_036401 [Datura stramonium]|uniref:Uncharacterized protein n=1 Tax=Datura stramonium TaxID=4076 RepID=A0ABS8VI34_DATST|nr:hypothetical protein [Datura stramonium]